MLVGFLIDSIVEALCISDVIINGWPFGYPIEGLGGGGLRALHYQRSIIVSASIYSNTHSEQAGSSGGNSPVGHYAAAAFVVSALYRVGMQGELCSAYPRDGEIFGQCGSGQKQGSQ